MTDVLLAFGTHGRGDDRPDRSFFRKAIVPFIESAAAAGRRVVVIHEFSVYERMSLSDEEKEALFYGGSTAASLSSELVAMHKEANRALRVTLDIGREGGPLEDWGFNEAIRKLNSEVPGAVLNLVEPQSVESMMAHMRICSLGKGIRPEGVGEMTAFIRAMAEDCLRRDLRLARMICESAALDPDAAIAVPRGSGHRGMAGLLEGKGFALRVQERLDCEDFMDKAVRASYSRALGDDELRAYAVLELEVMKFVHAQMSGIAGRVAAALGAGRFVRERAVRKGVEMLEKEIAGGRFELPVPGL